MGDMNGYEVARQIKQIDVVNHVPIIFLTSLSDRESHVKCLESGGDDFITKPFHYEILKAKVRAALRIRSAYKKLQQQDAEVKLFHERLRWEQDVTESIFKQIIGDNQPLIAGCRTYLSPAALSCGDFILAAEVLGKPHTFQFVMGDFTGHGLSAAIGTLPVSNWFNEFVAEGRSIQEIAFLLNNNLKKLLPASHFCAATLFQLDMITGELQVINAGLPDLLIASEKKGIVSSVFSNRLPLGIIEQEIGEFTPQFLSLNDGEHIFAYTDGIIEATNILGEMFGSERLKQIFIDNSSEHWFDTIIRYVDAFQSKEYQRDDITLIEVSFLPELHSKLGSELVTNDIHKLISVTTAAGMLAVSENMLRAWISNGVINSTQDLNNRMVLMKQDIYEIIEKRKKRSLTKRNGEITIVLVEDDKALLEIYTGLIGELDVTVNLVTATNGYEGLLSVGQYNPEILITDLMMPEMNGFELIKSVRNNINHQNVRIIATTALKHEQIDNRGGLPDEVVILEKPFTLDALRRSVEEIRLA